MQRRFILDWRTKVNIILHYFPIFPLMSIITCMLFLVKSCPLFHHLLFPVQPCCKRHRSSLKFCIMRTISLLFFQIWMFCYISDFLPFVFQIGKPLWSKVRMTQTVSSLSLNEPPPWLLWFILNLILLLQRRVSLIAIARLSRFDYHSTVCFYFQGL